MGKTIYKVRVPDSIAKLIRKMHPYLKKKIRSSLETILLDPYSGKALKGELAGPMSFKVSRFRIIYKVSNKIVEIVTIAPRELIYKETYRIIKKETAKEWQKGENKLKR